MRGLSPIAKTLRPMFHVYEHIMNVIVMSWLDIQNENQTDDPDVAQNIFVLTNGIDWFR